MKRLLILGATGSIGSQALEVVSRAPDEFELVGLSASRSWEPLVAIAQAHGVRRIALADPAAAARAQEAWTEGEVLSGGDGVMRLVAETDADLVLNAIVGAAGLGPTVVALTEGIDVAIANKETLVAGGELVMALAEATGARLIPVDSEHSALQQLIDSERAGAVDRLVLTASGGPFRGRSRAELEDVTIEQALAHPTWAMGGKNTIDSATLMNKALEVIEARWLFDLTAERIDVVVHPESVVHSFVEFVDGSVLAQLSPPDMRLPIQYALTYPDRVPGPTKRLDWRALAQLRFEPVDRETFPALDLGAEVVRHGGSCGAVLNGANEAAVARFLNREIGFLEIARCVRAVLQNHPYDPSPTLERLLALDGWARQEVARWTPSPTPSPATR